MSEFLLGNLSKVECVVCGIYFGLPTAMLANLKERGATFYCPNGHALSFNDTTIKKLQNQIGGLRLELNGAREEIHRQREVIKRVRQEKTLVLKRVSGGVCPHCHRHFTALERHIRTKHTHERNKTASLIDRPFPAKGTRTVSGSNPGSVA